MSRSHLLSLVAALPFFLPVLSCGRVREAPIDVPGDTSGAGAPSPSLGLPTYKPPAVHGAGPPAISGGTLLLAADGRTAVAADPDRDRVWLADLSTHDVFAQVTLQRGDEPGRVAEGPSGLFHVALRRGGAVVSFTTSGIVQERRPVCPAPRGLSYDSAADLLYVACMTGELVTLPSQGTAGQRTLHIERDLRDVVLAGGKIFVSRFRTAEVIQVNTDGIVQQRVRPQPLALMDFGPMGQLMPSFEAAVAWRMLATPDGQIGMVHQRESMAVIDPSLPGGYGGKCGGIVRGGVVAYAPDGLSEAWSVPELPMTVLPVDVALSPDGSKIAVAAAGTPALIFPQVVYADLSTLRTQSFCRPQMGIQLPASATATAVAFTADGQLIIQSREPALLFTYNPASGGLTQISLSSESQKDTGHDLFHGATQGMIACASCHAEGGEDGRIWQFARMGARRTQSLRGGLLGTEPFHWGGDQADFTHLFNDVFTRRMGGSFFQPPTDVQIGDLARYVDSLPAPRAPSADAAAVLRGQQLFAGSAGCTACHSGAKFTNNQTLDVGTGGAFQVPLLIGVGYRAPFLHNGCAATLHDRFGPCGGTQHGQTASLLPAQVDDLVAYLESL